MDSMVELMNAAQRRKEICAADSCGHKHCENVIQDLLLKQIPPKRRCTPPEPEHRLFRHACALKTHHSHRVPLEIDSHVPRHSLHTRRGSLRGVTYGTSTQQKWLRGEHIESGVDKMVKKLELHVDSRLGECRLESASTKVKEHKSPPLSEIEASTSSSPQSFNSSRDVVFETDFETSAIPNDTTASPTHSNHLTVTADPSFSTMDASSIQEMQLIARRSSDPSISSAADASTLDTSSVSRKSSDTAISVLEEACATSSPEATISANALKCANLAAVGGPDLTTMLTFKGDDAREKYMQGIRNKVSQVCSNIEAITREIGECMGPSAYTNFGLNKLTTAYDKLLVQVATQDTGRPEKLSAKLAAQHSSPGYDHPRRLPAYKIEIVDTQAQVSAAIDEFLTSLDAEKPYHASLDVEARRLSRQGDLSIVQIYIPPLQTVFLVDVAQLGSAAFTTRGTVVIPGILESKTATASLGDILCSTRIKKLMWDCRNDNDVLSNRYNIQLGGIVDTQLLYQATRIEDKERNFFVRLDKAIANFTRLETEPKAFMKRAQRWGQATLVLGEPIAKHFEEEILKAHASSKKEGDAMLKNFNSMLDEHKKEFAYECCNVRPIPQLVQDYCATDVVLLPDMYEYCISHCTWNSMWAKEVEKETRKRLDLAKLQEWPEDKTFFTAAPEGWAAIEQTGRDDQEPAHE